MRRPLDNQGVIFGNESISTYSRTNLTIWMILAFQAGLLNIGGLLACHSFVSHVTGFATLFGLELNRVHYWTAMGMLIVPLFFLLGAMLSGFLVDLRLQMRKKPKYYIVFGALFLILLFVVIGGFNRFFGAFGEWHETSGDYTLLALLCLACGVQNGTVALVSRSVVRTTHLTGITTDLGIGLVRVLNQKRIPLKMMEEESKANFMRIGIICSFIAGSAFGVPLFDQLQYRGFLVPTLISGLLFFTTFYFQVMADDQRDKSASN
jgi:uncharacterized membrane protein YoaK (UPF0700 family)